MVGLWQDTTGCFEQMPLNGNVLPDYTVNENGPVRSQAVALLGGMSLLEEV